MSNPEPYTCKHSCERDELKDEIRQLQSENDRLRAENDRLHIWLEQARDKALEEAAKKVLRLDRYRISTPSNLSEQAAAHAKAIRAMKGKQHD